MQGRNLWAARLTMWLLFALTILPLKVYAQSVTMEELDDWFYSRLTWGVIIGAALGALVGVFHLCRLEYKVSSNSSQLSVDRQARRKFGLWLLLIIGGGGTLLFLDAWLNYQFGAISLEFGEVLGRVWMNYRTPLILAATLASFTVLVALVTRMKRTCRCQYAFIPGPRGK